LEDDPDDQELIETIIREIGVSNEIRFLKNGEEGLTYLRTTEDLPFIIICDVNMPMIDGFEFKLEIDRDPTLREKHIPFVFLSTSANKPNISKIYSQTTVQGYFIKPAIYNELQCLIQMILDYWMICMHPNDK
jgi:CheY-like chemotaxis protein